MPYIDVDINSFKKVRDSLSSFKENIAGFSGNIDRDTRSIVSSCEQQVNAQKQVVNELDEQRRQLERELSNIESEIKEKTNDWISLNKQKEQLKSQKASLESMIANLQAMRDSIMQNQKDENGSSSETVAALDGQIAAIRTEIIEINEKIEIAREVIGNIETQLDKLEYKKSETGSSLFSVNLKLDHNKIKLEKLADLLKSIRYNAKDLSSRARSLETDSTDIASHSKSCVDQCIQYLDEYLNS